MRPFSFLASTAVLCVVLLPLATPSCGGATTTPPTQTGGSAGSMQQGGAGGTEVTTTDTCMANDDCVWGEIKSEILKPADCICLYGCGYLPQTKVTAARRLAQYRALCNSRTDGKGESCGVDDCAVLNGIACLAGTCKAAPGDGGMVQ